MLFLRVYCQWQQFLSKYCLLTMKWVYCDSIYLHFIYNLIKQFNFNSQSLKKERVYLFKYWSLGPIWGQVLSINLIIVQVLLKSGSYLRGRLLWGFMVFKDLNEVRVDFAEHRNRWSFVLVVDNSVIHNIKAKVNSVVCGCHWYS